MAQLDSLYEVLENLIALHKALYTLAVQKKDVLIKGDVDALVQITHQEQKLIRAVEAAENKRMELVQELISTQGLTPKEATLSELIKSLNSAAAKTRLAQVREELLRIVSELREANELNQQLLEQSLSFVTMSLDLLTDSPEEDFFYKNPVKGPNMPVNRSFINKKA